MPAARTRAAGISPLNVKPAQLLEDAQREREVRLRDLRAGIPPARCCLVSEPTGVRLRPRAEHDLPAVLAEDEA